MVHNNPYTGIRTLLIQIVKLVAGFLLLFGLSSLQAQLIDRHNVRLPQDVRAVSGEPEISLAQAIDIALANNTQLKQALLSVKDADQQVLSAWGEVMPSISSDMNYTRNMEIPVNFLPAKIFNPSAAPGELMPVQFGTDNNWSGGVTVSQTIFRGQAIVGISSSAVYKLVQSENYRATAQQIVTQTRLAYYNVLIAQERFELQKASINRLKKNLQDNQARQRAGLLDEYDVLRLKVQLSNQRPRLTQARYGVDKAYRNLSIAMGLPVDFQYQVQGNLKAFKIDSDSISDSVNASLKTVDQMTPFSRNSAVGFTRDVFERRGDLRMLTARQALKDRELLAAKSRFLPTISATYNLRWNAAEADNPDFFATEDERARSQAIGLTVSLPLFQGFQRKSAVQRVQIQAKELRLQQESLERSANNEIQSAQESIRQALETAEARRIAIKQAQRGYDIALARLAQGVGSQLDVTNAELQYREAELNYARMVFQYLTAKAQYDQAVGMVPFINEKYQP